MDVPIADLTFEFFDISPVNTVGALDWVSIDSAGTITVTPTIDAFRVYPLTYMWVGITVTETVSGRTNTDAAFSVYFEDLVLVECSASYILEPNAIDDITITVFDEEPVTFDLGEIID